ncbi:MAG: hypothetical protein U0837_09340 [Dehalococcoidia bacterium]
MNGSAPITAEALVAAQPDVILVLTAGLPVIGGIDGVLKIPGVDQTPAGRTGEWSTWMTSICSVSGRARARRSWTW